MTAYNKILLMPILLVGAMGRTASASTADAVNVAGLRDMISSLNGAWTNKAPDMWSISTNIVSRIPRETDCAVKAESARQYEDALLSLKLVTDKKGSDMESFTLRQGMVKYAVGEFHGKMGAFWAWRLRIGYACLLLSEHSDFADNPVVGVDLTCPVIDHRPGGNGSRHLSVEPPNSRKKWIEARRSLLERRALRECRKIADHPPSASDLESMTPEQRREIEVGIDSIRRGAFGRE